MIISDVQLQRVPKEAVRDLVLHTDSAGVHFTGHCPLQSMQAIHERVPTHC